MKSLKVHASFYRSFPCENELEEKLYLLFWLKKTKKKNVVIVTVKSIYVFLQLATYKITILGA